jgi:uncharacterized FlgJ-related protein
MTSAQITISLPEPVLRQLMRISAATHQSLESLITQSVLSNLPPSTDNAPPELQPELLEMQAFSIQDLQTIAQSQIDPIQQERHIEILRQNADNRLTAAERQELSNLRQAADRLMLRKAYAWSILRWRGARIPALEELSVPL